MEQIKVVEQVNGKMQESQTPLFLDDLPVAKRKHVAHLQMIEPWMEEPEGNPFMNLKSKQIIIKKQSPRVKRQASLTLARNWKSSQKAVQNRESKILPVMNIGRLNSIKKGFNAYRNKEKHDQALSDRLDYRSGGFKEVLLPSVKRELMIERKLFLMRKSAESSPGSSPTKSGRMRKIINDIRL